MRAAEFVIEIFDGGGIPISGSGWLLRRVLVRTAGII